MGSGGWPVIRRLCYNVACFVFLFLLCSIHDIRSIPWTRSNMLNTVHSAFQRQGEREVNCNNMLLLEIIIAPCICIWFGCYSAAAREAERKTQNGHASLLMTY